MRCSDRSTCSLGGRGLTLLEMLIYVAVLALVSVATLRILADGRVLRERAKQRAELALLAQSELDRLRGKPLETLTEGAREYRDEAWSEQVTARENVTRRKDGYAEIRVELRRQTRSGELQVELVSLHPEQGSAL